VLSFSFFYKENSSLGSEKKRSFYEKFAGRQQYSAVDCAFKFNVG
jgi:hypothetical protein